MARIRFRVVPVGKADPTEIEAAITRAAKILKCAVQLNEAIPVPRGTEDVARRQHPAASLLGALVRATPTTATGKVVGPEAEPSPRGPGPSPTVYVTDVDLFTPNTEGVIAHLDVPRRSAVLSVRRLREAFYRRKADPKRQKARLVKETVYLAGRLLGLPDCPSPECAMAPARNPHDIDRKAERMCRGCALRLG